MSIQLGKRRRVEDVEDVEDIEYSRPSKRIRREEKNLYRANLSLPKDDNNLIYASELLRLIVPPFDISRIDYEGMMNIINVFQSSVQLNYSYPWNSIIDFNELKIWKSSLPIHHHYRYHNLVSNLVGKMRDSLYANADCKRNEYSIQKYISSGLEGSTFRGKIEHPTIKHKLITNKRNEEGIPVVIKLTNGDSNNNYKEQIIHEAAIGVALNSLSNLTPNFMYFYGLLPCDLQINGDDIKQSNICNDIEYPGYPVFEYIEGTTFEDAIDGKGKIKLNRLDIVNILCQVLLSLAIASDEIKFTHYDLHHRNIMVVDLGQEKDILYQFDGSTFKWKTRYLAKIIDYGRSYAKFSDKEIVYNMFSYEQSGFRAGPNHQYDFIQLATEIYDGNQDDKYELENILLKAINHLFVFDTRNVSLSDIRYKHVLPLDQQNMFKYSAISVFDYLITQYILSIEYMKDELISELMDDIPYNRIFKKSDKRLSNICITNKKDKMNNVKRRVLSSLVKPNYSIKAAEFDGNPLINAYRLSTKEYINEVIQNYNDIVKQYTDKFSNESNDFYGGYVPIFTEEKAMYNKYKLNKVD